jgi:two-component system sensor histidine kinase/response regulator
MWMTALIIFSVTSLILLIVFAVRSMATNKLTELQKKRIEELIQTQKDNEKQISELELEKQHLFSVVSHDLKGPFNRIFALIQLLQSSSDNFQNDQKEYLAKIHRVLADGLGMIRNLMDHQKLESKGIDLHLETFNLASVLGVLARNYKVIAEKKNIQLDLEMLPTMIVYADKHYLHRILDNLLSNALKFSSENKNIFINAHEDGNWISVEVRDEGPGISEEDQTKLYKKFQTLTARPTGGETATGIGLSIAKTLAEKMKAELSCVSKLDEGSLFTLRVRKERIV